MSGSTEKQAILELFNLDQSRIKEVEYHNDNGSAVVDILLRADYPPCPGCGCKEPEIKEYILRRINHSLLTERKCTLYYHARRYRCPVCHRTYYENNPFCFGSQQISSMTVHNVLRDLKKASETFAAVAERYHISPTTAASIFDQHVQESRRKLPELMCWDEAYAFHHKDLNSKYVFTILDFENEEPVDILPCRRKDYLMDYFLRIPLEERKAVKMISTDMYAEYRSIIHDLFGTAYHCVDHYHLSQELSRQVDRVRVRVMKSVPKYVHDSKVTTNEYYLLKTFNWMIFKRSDAKNKDGSLLFDPGNTKQFNRKLNRYLNFYDIRTLIENIDPDLRKAWDLKDKLVDFYNDCSYETAPDALNSLIQMFASSSVSEMRNFAKTLRSWKEEIINSFIIVKRRYKTDKDTGEVAVSEVKMNNGLMENRNSIIKTVKKTSNGYTNWNRFRNRNLYVLRKNSAPTLNPIIPPKKGKV